ncbi:MAG: hypothetical protein KBT02_08085 [Treponema sp.]|nr:hypothetical protein [Candidatus Treponema caballi]
MKKVLLLVLLCINAVSLFAKEENSYQTWDEIVYSLQEDKDFIKKKNEYQAQYETVVRDVLPFFEAMDTDAEIDLNYFYYTTAAGTKEYTAFLDYYEDDMCITFYAMELKADGLHGCADIINLGDDLAGDIWLSFDDVLMKSDGTFVTGICNNNIEDNTYACHEGQINFSLLDAYLENTPDGRIVVCNDFEFYSFNSSTYPDEDSTLIKAGKVTFDWNGNILSYTPCKEKHSYDINGTVCHVSYVEWEDEEMILKGEFEYPELKLTGTSNKMLMDCYSEYVYIDEPDTAFTFNVWGFSFKGHGLHTYVDSDLVDEYVYLDFGEVELLYDGRSIPVGKMTLFNVDEEPEVEGGISFYGPIRVHAFGPYDYMTNITLDDSFQGILYGGFPEPFSGGVEYGSMTLNPDGSVVLDPDEYYYGMFDYMYFGGFTFSADYSSQDKDSFTLSDVSIGVPQNCIVTGLSLYNALSVKYDGTAEIVGYSYPFNGPGDLCGLTFSPDGMEFTKTSLKFWGKCWLPDTLPGMLSGRNIEVELELNTNGSIKSFESSLAGTYQIQLPDSTYGLTFSGAFLEVDQSVVRDHLSPYTTRLVLKSPQFYNSTSVSKKVSDIAKNGKIAFTLDGTLMYKLPDMDEWAPLNLRTDN